MSKVFPPIGMSPQVWGPIFWTTMHIVSMGYPEKPSQEEQQAAASFYNSLSIVIPCPICREHYSFFLKKTPVEGATGSRATLIEWCFNLHNDVNKQLGKPALSWDDFIAQTAMLRDKGAIRICEQPNYYEPLVYVAVGALLGVGGYYAYKTYSKN